MTYEEVLDVINSILDFTILSTENTTINLRSILYLVVLFVITRLILSLIKRFFRKNKNVATITGSQNYILQKITQYIIIIAAIMIALESVGLELTFLLAGSAALFVGIGLGIQDVFKDVIAGFILLFGKAIKVGDVIEIEGVVGRVTDIDFRVSKIVTRDDIDMLIPNAKLINDKVINWSYNNELTRFSISVGVAYGSDTQLVKSILSKVAEQHPDVSKLKQPFVRFTDFGNSSLDFQLFFWSDKTFRIENILSDMRFDIDNQFRKNNVTIPFPQRDVHIKQS
jgi:small-conductance mechanosensitive channel